MEKILKNSRVNVCIHDKETKEILFKESNLFVDNGRALIATLILGNDTIDKTKYVCDFGDDATAPTASNVDLSNYTSISVGVNEPAYPQALIGSGTGVHFQFIYTAAINTTIRELGLFYRPVVVGTPVWPGRGTAGASIGEMLSRLRTTYSSIFVGSGRIITIDWKIIF